ncbi:MAG: hypothetical protein U9Q40_06600 [Campylobacterota bacterium]|nr:hypothetical protein [Campylobacterota bacterium]
MIHGNDAKFFADDSKLYLVCSSCESHTVVSEATTHDELRAIFDKNLMEAIQSRVTAQYVTWLIETKGAKFPFTDEAIQQIKAVQDYIPLCPHILFNFDSKEVMGDGWSVRLIFKSENIKVLKEKFFASHGFDEVVALLNKILKADNKEVLKKWVVDKTKLQIEDSVINGIEKMTVKRLKNLYSNKKDCNTIDSFIPYIEAQRV